MNDLSSERQTTGPEVHHLVEIFKPITTGQRFALVEIKSLFLDEDLTPFRDFDGLYLDARGTHEKLSPGMP